MSTIVQTTTSDWSIFYNNLTGTSEKEHLVEGLNSGFQVEWNTSSTAKPTLNIGFSAPKRRPRKITTSTGDVCWIKPLVPSGDNTKLRYLYRETS